MYTKIIISGKRCSGKTTLFWNLQKILSWATFTVGQYLRDYIRIYHRTPKQIEDESQKLSKEIDMRIHKLLISPHHVIIDSRVFGNIIQPYPETLRILLTADDATRVERAALREQTTIDKQKHKFLNRESEWLKRISTVYSKDLFAPQYFDLVVPTERKTPQEIIDIVLSKINEFSSHLNNT